MEEYVEVVHDLKQERAFETNQIVFKNDTAKCGEVMVGCRGEFTFICALCEQHFIELLSFGSHIKDFHLNYNSLNTISIENDPSKDAPCEGRSSISVSPQLDSTQESIYLETSTVANPIHELLEISILETVDPPYWDENEGSNEKFSSCEENTPFSSSNKEGKHIRSCTEPRRFVCPKVFLSRQRSQLHINSHSHSTNFAKHKCAILGSQKRDFALVQDEKHRPSDPLCAERSPISGSPQRESEPESPLVVPLNDTNSTHNKLDMIILDKIAASDCNDKEGLKDDVSRCEESTTKVGEFVCQYCGRSYQVKSSYIRHMKQRHPNGVPDKINCKYCYKEFKDLVQFEAHRRTHTGRKRYFCRFCPRVFDSSSRRQNHHNVHTGERSYKCPHCPKSFAQRFDLRNHKRKHLRSLKSHSVSRKCENKVKSLPESRPNLTKQEPEIRTIDTVASTDLNAESMNEISRCEESTTVAILPMSTKEGEFVCGYCGRKYKAMSSFKRHMKKNHSNGVPDQIICKYCFKEFEDLVQLEAHVRKHKGRKRYVCRFCPKLFVCSQSRQFHMNVHTGERPYKCSDCPKTFAYLKQYKSHKRKHHEINQNECKTEPSPLVPIAATNPVQMELEKEICDTVVSSDRNANEDLKDEDSKDEDSSCEESSLVALSADSIKLKKFFCELCVGSYQTKKSYMDHMKNKHGNEDANRVPDEMICMYCDKEFDDLVQLRAHIAIHTGIKRFVCSFCSKKFRTRRERMFHINTHTGERPYKCSYCPKTFSHPNNIEKHEHVHLQIKKYSCDYCDKRFVQNQEKKSHERTHTGEMPFQCDECGLRFRSHVKMTEHGRRHKNIKPYVCQVCSKAFYTSALLKDHSIAHSKERVYQCNVCDKNYTRRRALKSHMLLHSNEKKYVCNICGEAFYQNVALYSHRKSHGEKL